MNCLKCGKATKGEQVFCDACLQVMDAYPIKSDTPIYLPKRNDHQTSPKKPAHRKKAVPAEEQILHLKAANRRLVLTVLGLILALGLCAGAFAYHLSDPLHQSLPRPGSTEKNYTYSPD